MRRLLGVAVTGVLIAASCSEAGEDGTDVRWETIVFDYGVPQDSGTGDPGSRPDDGHHDPGGQDDPGTLQDPGGGNDPGGQDDPGTPQDPGGGNDPGGQDDPGTPQDPGGGNDPGGPDDPGTDPGTPSPCSPVAVAGSCRTFYECLADCTTEACANLCVDALSAEGMADYQALERCLEDNGCYDVPDDDFTECLDAFCLDAYYGCFWGCTYPTCAELVDCIVACPDNACVGDCWSEATTGAQIDLQDTLDCMSAACPVCAVANPTPAQQTECDVCWDAAADTTCAAYWEACANYGTGNCRTLWTCYNACEDSPCVQACVDETDQAGLDLFFAVFDCIDTYCDDSLPEDEWLTCANAALNDECAGAYAACQADAS